jgi:hypothetical protein
MRLNPSKFGGAQLLRGALELQKGKGVYIQINSDCPCNEPHPTVLFFAAVSACRVFGSLTGFVTMRVVRFSPFLQLVFFSILASWKVAAMIRQTLKG